MRDTGLLLMVVCCSTAALASERSDLKIGDHFLDLEYRAGSGSQRSIVIVDFAATGGDTYAFEYRYEGTKNGHDALEEIASMGDLVYWSQEFDLGNGPVPFLKNLDFRNEQGDADQWSYSLGAQDLSSSAVSWTSSPVGNGDRILTDGSWDGWYNRFGTPPDYEAIPPAIPTVRLPGDYNDDEKVAQGDLDLVLLNWGAAPEIEGWVNQIATDDGIVDQNDLDDVLLYWGATLPVGASAVPEPNAAVLGCLSLLLWGWTRSAGSPPS